MSTTSRSSSGSRPASCSYDTGFPESFAAYTTSLRHPDAIVTPGACISGDDVDPSRTLQRSRRSFLTRHKRTISHGVINKGLSQKQSNSSMSVLPSIDSAVEVDDSKSPDTAGSLGLSKDGAESIGSHTEDSTNGDYTSAADVTHNEDGHADDTRRRSKLFRKWRS
ncbi:hypothetical protein F4779DRAFT_339734 [Xylariaceae sp. FL0662B]|nr:hypothetical protein F4779DRAFT_339734 [Xylariaceae sp. FL0662B]